MWLEITTLLIPDENDSDQELHAMCQWIADHLGPDIPLHFSAFHPDFKMRTSREHRSIPRCAPALSPLLTACTLSIAATYMILPSDATYCPACHQRVIERDRYQLGDYALDDTGHCLHCGHQLPGRFAGPRENFGPRRIPVADPSLAWHADRSAVRRA
ncbi:hypothetical protein [Vibrio ostreae]|uniref:hypothetical protein n=1 Tax=Vibrio ostreae TaxID=2841925 RepID=UPI002113E7DE|nr:hypothetical protein [Vibrio ostreae]